MPISGRSVLFAVSDPDPLSARADSIERLDHLRQGLSELTDLASCRYVTGSVPPVTLVRSSLQIIEAVAPVESVEVVIDLSPVEPLVGDETDTALLLVLRTSFSTRVAASARPARSGRSRVGLGESDGGIDFTFDLDGRKNETGLARTYALAASLAAAYGATMVERGAMLMPVLCLPVSTTAGG